MTLCPPPVGDAVYLLSDFEKYRAEQVAEGAKGNFICRMCGRKYSCLRTVRRHFKDSHAQKDFHFVCPARDCGKTYDSKTNFYGHLYYKHKEYQGFNPMEFIVYNSNE